MRLSQLESNGRRLLVVDDEPSIWTLVKQMLEMKGFQNGGILS
jgi:CheY-like chemotaxis protein